MAIPITWIYVVLFPSISTFETVGMGWTLPSESCTPCHACHMIPYYRSPKPVAGRAMVVPDCRSTSGHQERRHVRRLPQRPLPGQASRVVARGAGIGIRLVAPGTPVLVAMVGRSAYDHTRP